MSNHVSDPFTSFAVEQDSTPLAVYDDTTDFVLDIRGMNDKAILVKNTGGASLDFTIEGSLDDGLEYDIVHLGDTAVAAGQQNFQEFPNYYTFMRIRVKSAGSTTATIKVAATAS